MSFMASPRAGNSYVANYCLPLVWKDTNVAALLLLELFFASALAKAVHPIL